MTLATRSHERRNALLLATVALGVVGFAAALFPFTQTLFPTSSIDPSRAKTIAIDISDLRTSGQITAKWGHKPIKIIWRSALEVSQLDGLSKDTYFPHETPSTFPGIQPVYRSLRPEVFVFVSLSTYLGCSIDVQRAGHALPGFGRKLEYGVLFDPCHQSTYDLAGRSIRATESNGWVGFLEVPNLLIPPHHFASDSELVIGEP